MSGSLSLVPRKFAKRTASSRASQPKDNGVKKNSGKVAPAATQPVPPNVGAVSESPSYRNITQSDTKGKGKATSERSFQYTDTDHARLLCLALSDYTLQSDGDLRRAIGLKDLTESGGYVPLNEVFKRFPLHYGVKSPTRSLMIGIVKTLRAKGVELVDVRLALTGSGGYELRRKDWMNEYTPPGLSYTKQEWDQRTVYLECIPAEHRNLPGILQFLTNLLEEKHPSPLHPWARIQGVTLPPHHQDQPGNTPICKDFCLVTFAEIDDAIFLTSRWPWSRKTSENTDLSKEEKEYLSHDVKNAIRFGLRTLSKTNWERLREEYLTYRSEVLNEINEYEDASVEAQPDAGKRKWRDSTPDFQPVEEDSKPVQSKPTTTMLTPDAPYPYGCLVFVRNIHPETNKTTLRTLFSSAFRSDEQDGRAQGPPAGLDYIDYSKGMDSCYLRLSTPTHTDLLVQHFERQRTIQADGLDDEGTPRDPSGASDKAITVEKITGKKEEVYWERVPEKVRWQAVQKVITFLGGEVKQNVGSIPEHQRKRRKN
ncbi:hypothetical protein JOM56_004532 [Amanita muscaria]